MIIANSIYNDMFNSVAREFVGRVELLEGSTLVQMFEHDGALQRFTIDKTGERDKFFGFGICQKAEIKLRDRERAINITKGQGLQIAHGVGHDYLYAYPVFFVDEVQRNENTNDLTITAYDAIYKATQHRVHELPLPKRYTLRTFAVLCAEILDMPISFSNVPDTLLDVVYTQEQANLDGTESIRDALNFLAEMFGAIYYLSNDWELTFQQLDRSGNAVLAIDKSKYFDLSVQTAHTLQNIASITELGDNVISSSGIEGETQYLRENPFLTLRDDVGTLLDNIRLTLQGLTIYQFECKHRGDFRAEIGDKISLTTKDNEVIETYILDDSITYEGGIVGKTRWLYTATEGALGNPTTLGDALKRTYARVDKFAGQITLLAEESSKQGSQIAKLELTSDSITQSVSKIDNRIDTLESDASIKLTPEDVSIILQTNLRNGVDTIRTQTGYVFSNNGLHISKTGAQTATKIDETGMYVTDVGGNTLLQANNLGVSAKDLTASTFLIIGDSRFETYQDTRTGCFWIGGID